ncbi:hypothetical protein C8R47DRAFT_1071951 [Mycena vitilis]|nr:hypothetical protein C8R47DRAFT_1071951 [Mycena vitilis]
MRASVSIYEDPAPKSEDDLWADDESRNKFYVVLAMSLAAAATLGYAGYQLLWMARSEHGFGNLLLRYTRNTANAAAEAAVSGSVVTAADEAYVGAGGMRGSLGSREPLYDAGDVLHL